MPRRGDFEVDRWDVFTARSTHDERSDRARSVDAEKRAPVTTNVERWQEHPGRFDFPGLDTPRTDPHVLPKDLEQRQKPDVEPSGGAGAPVDPLGPLERETITFEAQAREIEGLSMSPEEAVEGVGSTSHRTARGRRLERWGGPANEEAFEKSEQGRTLAEEFDDLFYRD